MIRVGHFFAGGGGGILASEILGHVSVLATDIDERRCEILRQRAAEGWFPDLHVECCDIREFDAEPWKGRMDCMAAGFPCQDISCAGSGAGIYGERSGLFFDFMQAVDVIRPSIIFLENSPRIRTRGRHVVIRELVERGYSWRDGTLAAAHVGAGHPRNRWWCLAANADGRRKLEQERRLAYERGWIGDGIEDVADIAGSRLERCWKTSFKSQESWAAELSASSNEDAANALRYRLQVAIQQGGLSAAEAETIEAAARYTGAYYWSPPDAGVCRVVDGLANRMDRIATCGDGQVPLQAAVAWALLAWPEIY